MEKELLEELVDLKLEYLYNEIDKILKKWDYELPDKFLQDAKEGIIEEAEDDAITLKHLIDQRNDMFTFKRQWNKE